MLVKVQMTLGIGMNSYQKEVLELDLPDNYTEVDLDAAWWEWASNYIDGGPYVLKE